MTDEAIAISAEHGFPIWQTLGTLLRGRVRVQQGETDSGLEQINSAVARYHGSGAGISRPYHLALRAEALEEAGHNVDALQCIDEALSDAEATGAYTEKVEILRVRAGVLLKRGDIDSAEAQLRSAVALAETQGARSFALRAATHLARLLHEQARDDEARDVLLPVHSAFTEGFGTPDLAEAAALLASLR